MRETTVSNPGLKTLFINKHMAPWQVTRAVPSPQHYPNPPLTDKH